MHARTEMLDLVVKDGRAVGVVVRDLVTGQIQSFSGHAVLLATGGYSNAFTSADMTVYLNSASANFLETMLWIDADRLAGLTDTIDQAKLDNQREVVLNERRQSVENRPYGIVEEYVGHGIGTSMHMAPDVLNYSVKRRGPRLRPGMVLAIEPMLTAGSPATRELDDGWTVVTQDGSHAAQWEHTVAIVPGGVWVLTAPDGGAEGLAPYGIEPTALG